MLNFEILIASYGRASLLRQCLESLEASESGRILKILLLTHREDVETTNVSEEFSKKLEINLYFADKKLSPGASRNYLVKCSKADYLFFLDDDASVRKNYFQSMERILTNNNFKVLGGPDVSNHSNEYQDTLGRILKNPLVMGPTSARHREENVNFYEADETYLTLCNLWVKRNIFVEHGYWFKENIKRCEENIFLEELRQAGFKMYLSPQNVVKHNRRTNLKELAMIQFHSGYYRGVVFHLNPYTRRTFFLIPLLTGIYLVLLPAMPKSLTQLLFTLHILLSVIVSFESLEETKKLRYFFLSWIYIIVIHLFFSLGILFGSIKGKIYKYD